LQKIRFIIRLWFLRIDLAICQWHANQPLTCSKVNASSYSRKHDLACLRRFLKCYWEKQEQDWTWTLNLCWIWYQNEEQNNIVVHAKAWTANPWIHDKNQHLDNWATLPLSNKNLIYYLLFEIFIFFKFFVFSCWILLTKIMRSEKFSEKARKF
jgi:hypothetical protein